MALKTTIQTIKIKIMKTSIKTLTTICTVIISLSASAQRNHNGNQPQSNNQPQNNNKNNERHGWGGNHHGQGPWGGNVSIHIGGNPNYYDPNNYGYGYNNNYNVKKPQEDL